jgi:formate/nitrite transporter FocA (FNT family)
LFWSAAVYDLTLGIVFLFFYRPVFEALGIEDTLPEYTSFVSLIAAFLFVIGIAYVFIARGDLGQNRDLIAIGAVYKLAYFSVALWYLIGGVYPHIVFFVVFGLADLAFFIAMTECWWFVRRLDSSGASG